MEIFYILIKVVVYTDELICQNLLNYTLKTGVFYCMQIIFE